MAIRTRLVLLQAARDDLTAVDSLEPFAAALARADSELRVALTAAGHSSTAPPAAALAAAVGMYETFAGARFSAYRQEQGNPT